MRLSRLYRLRKMILTITLICVLFIYCLQKQSERKKEQEDLLIASYKPIHSTEQHLTVTHYTGLKGELVLSNQVGNEHDFRLCSKPQLAACSHNSRSRRLLPLLVIVQIAPDRFRQRTVIRETWAKASNSQHTNLSVFFAFGWASDSKINKQVAEESALFSDILQEDFTDSYNNVTLSVIAAFKWAAENCVNAQHVLKINDDVVVNTPKLVEFLHTSNTGHFLNHTLIGNLFDRSLVHRDPKSEYYVSREQFKKNYWFPYMEGSAYLLSGCLLSSLFNLSRHLNMPPLSTKLEDVYVSFMALHLGVGFVNVESRYMPKSQYERVSFHRLKLDINSKSSSPPPLFVHVKDEDEFKRAWNILSSGLEFFSN